MRLKLDENLPIHLKAPLAALGHDALTTHDESLLHRPDTEVAAAAAAESHLLPTLDVGFGDLRKYPPGSHPGIGLFRPRSLGEITVNRFVLDFAAGAPWAELAGCVAVVDPGRLRVRRPEPQ
jgi:predicted nuclease of predicted toxin-antitoxin system